jgi:hypothetical protein
MLVNVNEYFHVGNINVVVSSYNTDYFKKAKEALGAHGLILTNFLNSGKTTFVEFLKDSVENDPYLNDLIVECDFEVKKDEILFNIENKDESYVNMCEYTLLDANVKITMSGGYLFVKDLSNGESYMYYAD